jgi:hypothetical protein
MEKIEIVVARYNEDLKWTLEYPFNQFKYTIYNKGINENFEKTFVTKIITLENVGRVNHTILYHIFINYGSTLADITIFFPGSLCINSKKKQAQCLLNRIISNHFKYAFFECNYVPNILSKFKNFKIDHHTCSSLSNRSINDETALKKSELRPYYKWFLHNFGNITPHCYVYKDIFSIHKNDILKHKKYRYEKLVNQVSTHSNPEISHYIERSWGAIFYPFIYTKVIFSQQNI